ncbi:MAG: hypothetical protein RMM58_05030 [Chloroflexota bacterium]|nr:hypothetical protein [Dehalococcoidia bacterium]MDW8253227.1 hypothetical protein [Chloroflexota bacterium]
MTDSSAPSAELTLPDWLDPAAVVIGDPPPLPAWLDSPNAVDEARTLEEAAAVVNASAVPCSGAAGASELLPPAGPDLQERKNSRSQPQRLSVPPQTAASPDRQRLVRPPLGQALAALALAAGLLCAVLFLPPPFEELPSSEVVRAFSAVDRLRPGQPVLLVLDYPPERASALAPLEASVVRHAASRGAVLIVVAPDRQRMEQVSALAPGALSARLPEPVTPLELSQRLGQRDRRLGGLLDPADRVAIGDRPVALVVVVGEQQAAANWLANLRTGPALPALAIIAGETSSLAPLRASGQVQGVLRGERDLRSYGALAGDGVPPAQVGAIAAGPATVAGMLLASAALVRLARRALRR